MTPREHLAEDAFKIEETLELFGRPVGCMVVGSWQEDGACEGIFAADAGYKSEADLVAQLEQPSEVCAKPATVEIAQRVSYDGAVALMDRETLEEVCDRLHDEAGRLGTRGPWPQEIADAYCAAHAERFGEEFVVN